MLLAATRRFAPALARATQAGQTASFASTRLAGKPNGPEPVPISKMYDSFLDGTSSSYLEDLERRYNDDPASVDKTWAGFFRHVGALTTARPSKKPDWYDVSAFPRLVVMYRERDTAGVHLRGIPLFPAGQDTRGAVPPVGSGPVQSDHPGVNAPPATHPSVSGATWASQGVAQDMRAFICVCVSRFILSRPDWRRSADSLNRLPARSAPFPSMCSQSTSRDRGLLCHHSCACAGQWAFCRKP